MQPQLLLLWYHINIYLSIPRQNGLYAKLKPPMLHFDDATESKKLDELYSQEAEELAKALSAKYQLPYIDLSKFAINTDALRLIDEEEAMQGQMAAFKIVGKNLFVVLQAPANEKSKAVLDDLRNKGYELQLYLGSEASLKRAWERYKEISKSTMTHAGVIDITGEDIDNLSARISNVNDVRQILETEGQHALAQGGISALLEIILAGSLATKASDIHIEPQDEMVRLRYRLDGVLQDVNFFDHKLYHHLLSRIKLVSGLKLNIQKSAQDGRFSIRLKDTEIEIRTSILPGAYGESIVLRILNPEAIKVTFESLGIEPHLFQIMEREINKPNGLVLLTGPTGSGKTTTLYAFLRTVNSSETKIITIEDPIEYHLKGINQTQVDRKKNYTFLSGLRSALRQDPDIIMVGEIRDSETAKIAVNASLTGHLVFSTLHTNNAAGTIPRLIDLGVNPKIIEAALNISIAQRLVRKLCPSCRKEDAPSPEERELLTAVLKSIGEKRPDLALPSPDKLYRAVGCNACNNTGYQGRQGIFEAVIIDNQLVPVITQNPNERDIRVAAKHQGILDMRQDGILKVLTGITALDELARVIDLHEEII